MTYEEAIKKLKYYAEEDPIKDMFIAMDAEAVEESDKLIDLCIDALGKQIPKKPINIQRFADIEIGNCPICNEGCNSEYHFCLICKQELDWGEENDI